MTISITKTTAPKEKPLDKNLQFGKLYTDHMFLMNYTEGTGWYDPRVVPYAPFVIDPASMVFHYAQEIFEGLKAYRTPDGSINLFRPMDNFRRLNFSAERLCIPQMDENVLLDGLKALLDLDADWVPHTDGYSLYIRPFVFASEVGVGVHTSREYICCIICSPVGAYYPEGLAPTKIMIEDEDVRAVVGGTGETKSGGNYAASLRAGERAREKGFSQVLWLDGVERKYIEEVGAMNVLFKIGDEIITPALSGSLLNGITRRSCLQILRDWGYTVTERLISVDELMAAAKDGTLEEAFGSGTAAVVCPVGLISYQGVGYPVQDGKTGALTQRLYETLTGIQWGKVDDPYGWTMRVIEG